MKDQETPNKNILIDEFEGPFMPTINIEEIGTATDPHPRPLSDLETARQELNRLRRESSPISGDRALIGRGMSTVLDGAAMMIDGARLATGGILSIATGAGNVLVRESAPAFEKLTKLRPYLSFLKRRG